MMRGIPAKILSDRIDELIDCFKLKDILKRRVRTLPWGPGQRLALACAMLAGPKLLLVDEILARGDFYSAMVILENIIKYVNEGNACIWSTGRLQEALNLAGGQPDPAELALTCGWDYTAPGDFSLNSHCKPGYTGYLNKGDLNLYTAVEFNDAVQGLKKGTESIGNGW